MGRAKGAVTETALVECLQYITVVPYSDIFGLITIFSPSSFCNHDTLRSYMKDWIEEFASLCDANASDKTGCSEQQIKFIDKWSGKLG